MRGCERTARLLLAGAAVAVIALGVNVSFGSPPDCPHAGIECPMIWDPVICNDGVVYSNKCVAKQNCAKGCVAYDGGPIPAGGERDTCDRPKVCPKLWAPVICDDGKVYPNECWAQKKCATGCVPYEEWMFPEGGARGNCEKPKSADHKYHN